MTTTQCEHCGVGYNVPNSQAKRTRFCSEKCMRASRKTGVYVRCVFCGKEFYAPKNKITKWEQQDNKTIVCSKQCSKELRKPKINDLKLMFECKGYILLSEEYLGVKSKLLYICKKHQDFGAQGITYGNFLTGYGCRYCGFEKTAAKKRVDIDKVIKVFNTKGFDLLEADYKNAHQPLKYICRKHPDYGIQKMSYANALSNGCPICAKSINKSKGEILVSDWLITNNISFSRQHTFDGLLGLGGRLLSYDFYVPSHRTLIEFQGAYHDGTANNQTDAEYRKQKIHDIRKSNYAKQNNLRLIEIWYYDKDRVPEILSGFF